MRNNQSQKEPLCLHTITLHTITHYTWCSPTRANTKQPFSWNTNLGPVDVAKRSHCSNCSIHEEPVNSHSPLVHHNPDWRHACDEYSTAWAVLANAIKSNHPTKTNETKRWTDSLVDITHRMEYSGIIDFLVNINCTWLESALHRLACYKELLLHLVLNWMGPTTTYRWKHCKLNMEMNNNATHLMRNTKKKRAHVLNYYTKHGFSIDITPRTWI